MIGLLFFGFLFVWIGLCVYVACRIGRRLPETRWRIWVELALVVALIPTLVIDEIVGGWQFRHLCAEESERVSVDPDTARGRAVYLKEATLEDVKGTMVPVSRHRWQFLDTRTDEVIVEFTTLRARGGVFRRTFGTTELSGPLIFDSYCAPRDSLTVFKQLDINEVERKRRMRARNDGY